MDRPTNSSSTQKNDYDKIQQIFDKVRDLKQSLTKFFMEYENGQFNWPTLLDQMNLLSSQITMLRALLRDHYQILRCNAIMPMCMSPDIDTNIEQITERRLNMFNHVTVPELLRTKNLPEIEERERVLGSHTINSTWNGRPIILTDPAFSMEFNKYLSSIIDALRQTRILNDKTDNQFDPQHYTSQQDTKVLLDAMSNGNELRIIEKAPISNLPRDSGLNSMMGGSNARNSATANVRIKTTAKSNR